VDIEQEIAEFKGEEVTETEPLEETEDTQEVDPDADTQPIDTEGDLPATLDISEGKLSEIPDDVEIPVLNEHGEEVMVKYRHLRGDGVFKGKYDKLSHEVKTYKEQAQELEELDDWLESDPHDFVVSAIEKAGETANPGTLVSQIIKKFNLNVELVDKDTGEIYQPAPYTRPTREPKLERESSELQRENIQLKMDLELNKVVPKFGDQVTPEVLSRAKEVYLGTKQYCDESGKAQEISGVEYALKFAISEAFTNGTLTPKKTVPKQKPKATVTKPGVPKTQPKTSLEKEIEEWRKKTGR
jgi:hypothetical protein